MNGGKCRRRETSSLLPASAADDDDATPEAAGNGLLAPTAINVVDYYCECPIGFAGQRCEVEVDGCVGVSCPDGRVCVSVAKGGHQCACPPGFAGDACQVQVDVCQASPCKNGGACLADLNSPTGFRY